MAITTVDLAYHFVDRLAAESDDLRDALFELKTLQSYAEAVKIKLLTDAKKDLPISPAKGEPMPKTIEYYQRCMVTDQELILNMERELSNYKQVVNKLEQKVAQLRSSKDE